MTVIIVILGVCAALNLIQRLIYKRLWDRELDAEVFFSKTFAYEGESVTLYERVSNGKCLPLPYVCVGYRMHHRLKRLSGQDIEDAGGEDRNSVFVVPMRRAVTKRTAIVCTKRGYYKINRLEISSGDIFLSLQLQKVKHVNVILTVYPKLAEIAESAIPYKSLSGRILTKRFILPDPFEFIGVREYQPYDSLSQINFKAWAKTGELMTNIYGYTASQRVRIYLNTQKYSVYKREAVNENAIRLAAFLSKYFLEAGIEVSLYTTGADIITGLPSGIEFGQSARHLHGIYGILARINLDEASPLPLTAPSGDDAVILISSLTNENLCAWFENTLASRPKLWIMPKTAADEIIVPTLLNVHVWEVPNE